MNRLLEYLINCYGLHSLAMMGCAPEFPTPAASEDTVPKRGRTPIARQDKHLPETLASRKDSICDSKTK
jgi:hypothetical protein